MKSYLSKLKRLRPKHLRRLPPQYLFIAVFMFVGIGTLLYTRAASPTAHFEAENASLSCATTGSDANASGGQFLKFSGTDCAGQTQTASSVTQYGITWTFSSPKTVGQFANGDWWVVGPVTITSMSPAYNSTTQENGWQVNPTQTESQGFDGDAYDFVASLIPSLPYNASAGQSIVKAVSVNKTTYNCPAPSSCLQKAAVLTVLGSVPANNGATVFRPPYFGNSKPMFSTNDMEAQMSILPRLSSNSNIDSDLPTQDVALDRVKRIPMGHNIHWSGSKIRPIDNFGGGQETNGNIYGPGISNVNVESFLRMMIVKPGDSETIRRQTVIALIQYGIDIYGVRAAGVQWYTDGGANLGFKLPMAFAGRMLNNQSIKNILINGPRNSFAEDGMIMQASTNRSGIPLWGQEGRGNEADYWTNLTANNSSANTQDPYRYIDGGGDPGNAYQTCCNSAALKGSSLIVRLIPGLAEVYNDNDQLIYSDRWVSHGAWTQPDPCAPVSQGGGPNPSRPGECKLDPDLTPGSTFLSFSCQVGKQCGRRPENHGINKDDTGWGSFLVQKAWPVYKNW